MPSKSAFFTIIITAQRQKFGIAKTRSISVFLMRNENKMYSKNAKKPHAVSIYSATHLNKKPRASKLVS